MSTDLEQYDPDTDDEGLIGPYEEDHQSWIQLGKDIRSGKAKVMLYACSRFDWEPLYRFSHKVDAFIYVDPSATAEGLNGALDTLRNGQTPVGAALKLAEQPGKPTPRSLSDIYRAFYNECAHGTSLDQQCDSDSWWYRMPGATAPECWGQAAQLTRTVGGQENPFSSSTLRVVPCTPIRNSLSTAK